MLTVYGMPRRWTGKPNPGCQLSYSHPLASKLVGFWLMNEGAGVRLNDLTANANTATLKGGAPWGASPLGSALKLNGSSQYANLAAGNGSLNLAGSDATIISLVNFSSLTPDSNQALIFGGYQNGGAFPGYGFEWSAVNPNWQFYDGAAWQVAPTGAGQPVIGSWDTYAAAKQGGTISFYKNGKLFGTATGAGAITSYSGVRCIGALSGGGAQWFPGSMAYCLVAGRAWSAAEVMSFYLDPFQILATNARLPFGEDF